MFFKHLDPDPEGYRILVPSGQFIGTHGMGMNLPELCGPLEKLHFALGSKHAV